MTQIKEEDPLRVFHVTWKDRNALCSVTGARTRLIKGKPSKEKVKERNGKTTLN